ncbi:MAG: 3-oxo-5-alpha-steroid 4-dehydrogenase, partial [Algiphilus sp.]
MMTWYTGDPVFDTILAIGLAFAVVTLLGSIFVPAPYGRFAQGSGINLHPKLGWWLMEIPATVVFLFFFLRTDPDAWTTTTLVLAGLWLLHY